jgi:hypothetical protein
MERCVSLHHEPSAGSLAPGETVTITATFAQARRRARAALLACAGLAHFRAAESDALMLLSRCAAGAVRRGGGRAARARGLLRRVQIPLRAPLALCNRLRTHSGRSHCGAPVPPPQRHARRRRLHAAPRRRRARRARRRVRSCAGGWPAGRRRIRGCESEIRRLRPGLSPWRLSAWRHPAARPRC